MSATRLLVLGVVRVHRSAHGYLVRSELVGWGADEWANVKWGSIYHALRRLATEGLLTGTDSPESPGRTDYAITADGDAEFLRLLRGALTDTGPRRDLLSAGLAFLTALPRAEAIELLSRRLAALEAGRAEVEAAVGTPGSPGLPLHVNELFKLWVADIAGGIAWTRELIESLRAGEYVMADDSDTAYGLPGSAHTSGRL
ncbi:PadR family transcriptional regulator [Nocardiopsis mangrovi]|uniref:PadR family transcriptional regulator n=1 Tax=Nocardiopsis mangrovi TaxID=1179818 RepID=A0ABV9DUC1_9ACTN